jgi:hypothetical protein
MYNQLGSWVESSVLAGDSELQCMQASPYSVELDQFYHQAETEVLPHTAWWRG